MSTKKKSNKMKFLVVVLGLFAVIGLIAGGTYILNEQGLISAGSIPEGGGERPEDPPPDFEEGGEMPARPEGGEAGGMGFNSQALMGIFKMILQIVIVVVIVVVGQSLYHWLVKRRRRSLAV